MPERPIAREDPDALTQQFLSRIEDSGALPAGVDTNDAVESVLTWLCHRISGGEARDFTERLPPPLRSLVRRRGLEHGEQPEVFDSRWFLHQVARELGISMDAADTLARAVFTSLRATIATQEYEHVESQLPRDILDIFRG